MTKIEWTEKTWNPTIGCTQISPGCNNCYAMKMAYRLEAMGRPEYSGLTKKLSDGRVVWTGEVRFLPERLAIPLNTKKPTTWFVDSMSDLFHHSVPDNTINLVMAAATLTPQHTYQLLTKRAERARNYFSTPNRHGRILLARRSEHLPSGMYPLAPMYPLPNVWLGVSVEDQAAVDRVRLLQDTPAAVRFLSCEPLLGRIDLGNLTGIHQVIAGAESGHGHRPMNEDWVRYLRDQCVEQGISFFYKQKVEKGKKIGLPELDGRVWDQMPNQQRKEAA